MRGYPGPHYDPHEILAELEACARRRYIPVTDGNLAIIAGVTIRTIQRWRNGPTQAVRESIVDRVAIQLGLHLSHFTPIQDPTQGETLAH